MLTTRHHEHCRRSSAVGLALLVMFAAFGCEPDPEFLEIGPETTVHSEPLRPDGVVDYTAHLEFPTGPNLYLAALALTQDDRYVSWYTIAEPLEISSSSPAPYETSSPEAIAAWIDAVDFDLFDEYLQPPVSQEFTCAAAEDPLIGVVQPRATEDVVALLLFRAEKSPQSQAAIALRRALELSRYVRRFATYHALAGLELEVDLWKTIASWSTRDRGRLTALAPDIVRLDAEIQSVPFAQLLEEHRLTTLHLLLDSHAKRTNSVETGRLPYSREMDEVLRWFVRSTAVTNEAISELVEPSVLEKQLDSDDFAPPRSVARSVLGDMRNMAIQLNHDRVMTAGVRWTTLALVAHVAGADAPTPPPVGRAQRIETDSELRWTFDCGEIHASTSWSK